MPDSPYAAFVVSHTHWDREWYRTFEVFRMRLVALMDALLDLLERDPDYGPYYLDGQVRPVEDYLEIRPEQAERLRRAFRDRRLYAGPWYVQPDEFLVSGEAIIRNLMMGRQACAEWSTSANIGYAPDAFGHIAQMPQLLRGFGIDNAVLFRGITADQVPSEFAWRSPDGSEVLCAKMPDDNAYSNWFYRLRETLADTDRGVELDRERVRAEAAALLDDSIRERPATPNLLWMDGVDHIFPQPRTPRIVGLVNELLGDRATVRTADLREFLDAVREARPELPVVSGELRVANRAWKLQALLTHVASSRINLKQRNHACETLLERWVEPWSAIAWALGNSAPDPGPHPADGNVAPASRRQPGDGASPEPWAFISHAWKTLLLNHPHDSICGCSVDQVHRDMLPRFDTVEQIGEALTAQALDAVARHADTTWTAHDDHDPEPLGALVVFNPLGWRRHAEEVSAIVYVPASEDVETVGVLRGAVELDARVEPLGGCHTLTQAPHDIPVGHAWKRFRVAFRPDVPEFGLAVHHIVPKRTALRPADPEAVQVGEDWIANGLIRLSVNRQGTLALDDLRTGISYSGLMAFEDGGDVGDGYNYLAPEHDALVRTTDPAPSAPDTAVEIRRRGSSASVVVRQRWYLPAGRDGSGRDMTSQAALDIAWEATLSPGSPRVDVSVSVENAVRDHRLRALFPSGAADADAYQVEQAFGAVTRPIGRPDCTGWREPQPGTGPQKTWVDVADNRQGLAVVNEGLPECEVLDDADRTVAVTLLRCTGQGVGLPEEQRDGQMLGTHRFRLAVVPHTGDWRRGEVWKQAHSFNVPMRAAQTDLHTGPIPDEHSFLTIGPSTLIPSALKRSEDGQGVVIRAYSVADEPAQADIRAHWPTGAVRRVRLDEAPADHSLLVLPAEIATFIADAPSAP